MVVGLPLVCLWVAEDQPLQVGQEFFDRLVQQARHAVEVNATALIQAYEQRFLGRANGFHRLPMMNRPLREDSRLGRPLRFVVIVLQREQQRQIRVAIKGSLVGAEIYRAIAGGEPVVSGIELLARLDHAIFRAAVYLRAQAIAHRVPHLDHAANSRASLG